MPKFHCCASRLSAAAGAALAVALVSAPAAHAQLASGDPQSNFDFSSSFITGATNATDVAPLPDGRLVVTLKGGDILVRRKNGTLNRNAGTIPVSPLHNEQGLLGVVPHPDYATNKTLFFYASTGDVPNKHRVLRGTLGDDDRVTVDSTPVVSMGLEGPANHNGGGLIVHKRHLYISVGDTGANATPPQNKYGSCLNKAAGKILRVDLSGAAPADNPLSDVVQVTSCSGTTSAWGMAAPDKRIWAWGFRNPWRFWIDPETDLMWIGDVGERAFEEISVGGKGQHFGYPFEEGTAKYTSLGMTCTDIKLGSANGPACTPPVHAYPPGDGRSVTGGLIPVNACGWPEAYRNRYFFGDHQSGRIWTLDVTADRKGVVANSRKDFARYGNNDDGPVSFRIGQDGTMYVVSHGGASVATVIPKNRPASCTAVQTPDGGAGGSGAGGVGGSAGASGSGGTGGGSANGGSGPGGNSGTGGSAGSPSGGAGRGGSAGGGSSGSGGAGGSNGDEPGEGDGGCSCRLAGHPAAPSGGFAFVGALAGTWLLVRRRRRR